MNCADGNGLTPSNSDCCGAQARSWLFVILGLIVGAVAGWLIGQRREQIAEYIRDCIDMRRSEDLVLPQQPQELVLEPAPAMRIPEQPQKEDARGEDDLTAIQGIGPVFATRLRAAGIRTYSQLAASSEGQLAAAIGAEEWRRPDYAAWIGQAAERSR